MSAEECDRLWRAWTPSEVAARISASTPCWYVAGGWALDLFTGGLGREHSDLEIGVPREQFAGIVDAFPGYEWDVVGDGCVWPYTCSPHRRGHPLRGPRGRTPVQGESLARQRRGGLTPHASSDGPRTAIPAVRVAVASASRPSLAGNTLAPQGLTIAVPAGTVRPDPCPP
ncbi:nucleotidyltransferase domain-containing protein [Nocardia higoensis]|uniref:nucleotidyltransferase domain-containing protein n=1 Tax=Nocardia higoensis TaxID=228599 RepID=UPI003A5CCE62